ncbi:MULTISPECIES: DUF1614 domain-containing protein [Sulfurisphaera]|uniref:DUF1614 domain-containing protein n=3 Tax=Sulfurisphaera TaxID=69655 RepID=Q974Q4_SULTO|nr:MULTISPECIES: DUF1614 domain-containing protein [Sulfurisphaera]MBB5252800.1 putative membrane protein [Sulfurisphaera ohwakuensis]QGR16259.1 DUF1614 domain-containing protein [Sulfurisphaera ohwakuensis]BAB65603.1 hypothetical protein STK_06050 [Sulfurisphaera tokodaii str. 7]HII74694.1 DUF1614 domain-containing protein [Sulfurisphaera tokodaii]
MAKRVLILTPFRGIYAIGYAFLGLIIFIISIGYFSSLLKIVGVNEAISYFLAVELALLSLILSPVNIVVKEINRPALAPEVDVVYVFGIPIYVPRLSYQLRKTLVAVNVGGAIIPSLLSITLIFLAFHGFSIILLIVDIILLSIICNVFSKVITGVGVVMNPLIAPLFSALISYAFFFKMSYLVPVSAYVSSVLGSLIGADLFNLKRIIESSPQIVSIGGMGTFDGIFMSGLFAVMLAEILILV